MPIINRNTIIFTMSHEQMKKFLKKIKDLTAIDSRIMVKIDPTTVLLFSFVGDSFKNIHAFKNYIFPIDQIMTVKDDIKESYILMIKDGKRLFKMLEGFLILEQDVNCKMLVDDENYINNIFFSQIRNIENKGKFEQNVIGSDPIAIGKEIGIDDINYLMDINNSDFNFIVSKSDFAQIKKTSLIYNEPKSVLYINVYNKMLSIGETLWHLDIAEVDSEDIILSFPKAYFNTINPTEYINIYVFNNDNFILCKYDDYNLMILLETSI